MTTMDSRGAANGSNVARLRLGTAPDSWGVWFADDPQQTPWQRFLDEVVTAGYEWVELGPYGYLPADRNRLGDELARRGLKVAGGTVHGVGGLHTPADWPAALDKSRRVAELTSALGARDLVFVPVPGYRDDNTGAYLEPAELDADDWQTLVRSTNELGKIIGQEYGVRLHFHEHADSHVETQTQIERFLDDTDPRYASLCLDTGHIAYRAGDSVALIRNYPERIGYVHIKQVDPEIARVAGEEGIPFGQAVKRGVCVEPPAGAPAIGSIVEALGELGRDLFVVVEQDLYPCAFDVPLPIAVRTAEYLRGFGLGVEGRPVAAGKEVER
jgi:inosose dehydratase